MMDNSFWVLYFMSPEFSVQKFPTQIIKFCVALITKIIRQGEQEGFLKNRQDEQDLQDGQDNSLKFQTG
jgi:hypothetical protein